MIWSERELEETTDQQPVPLEFSAVQAGEGSEHEREYPAPLRFDDIQSEVSEMRGRGNEKADNSSTECEEKIKQEEKNMDSNEGEESPVALPFAVQCPHLESSDASFYSYEHVTS